MHYDSNHNVKCLIVPDAAREVVQTSQNLLLDEYHIRQKIDIRDIGY